MSKHLLKWLIFLVYLATTIIGGCVQDPLTGQAKTLLRQLRKDPQDVILFWNGVTLQACSNDYNTDIIQTPDQLGPTTTVRAFAIIHGAMYQTFKQFDQIYQKLFSSESGQRIKGSQRANALQAAIAEAAYLTLNAMYPQQPTLFDEVFDGYIEIIRNQGHSRYIVRMGISVGEYVASAILKARSSDNSQLPGSYTPINQPGYHQVDPTHPNQSFLSPNWGNVTTFVIPSAMQYLASNVVGDSVATRLQYINSQQYINDYNEVIALGTRDSHIRTADQTEIGIFWGYDGSGKAGVPPRHYNQAVRVIAIQMKNTLAQNARLFALVNYALGDAAIAAWLAKYHFSFWRPIVGIRTGTASTPAISDWLPLGAPADGHGDNFTPPFPSYVSGHSTFGSATFETLRLFYGTDNIQYELGSDEYNGITRDSITGQVRPLRIRKYQSFTQAEDENFLSRIYLGVHWRIDQAQGKVVGRAIAQYIFAHLH